MQVITSMLTVVVVGLGFILIAPAIGWAIDKVRDLVRNR